MQTPKGGPPLEREPLKATGTEGNRVAKTEAPSNGVHPSAHHAAQLNGKTWREMAETDQTEGDACESDDRPETLVFPGKTQENQGKTARGAGGIRTPDGGFAIRCLKPLGHGAGYLTKRVSDKMGSVNRPDGPDCREVHACKES
jgi:hypothetical protein